MQGGGRGSFNFGAPFGGFNNGPRSLMSNFFGGRDPFDDPFFTQLFGGGMFQSNFFGPSMDPFAAMHHPPTGIIENHHQPRRSHGPIIEEIESDDEKEKRVRLGKHGRSSSEVDTEEEARAQERRNRRMQNMNVNNGQWQPQTRSYSFQRSTVTHGGHDGNYYSSSKFTRTELFFCVIISLFLAFICNILQVNWLILNSLGVVVMLECNYLIGLVPLAVTTESNQCYLGQLKSRAIQKNKGCNECSRN